MSIHLQRTEDVGLWSPSVEPEDQKQVRLKVQVRVSVRALLDSHPTGHLSHKKEDGRYL